MQSASKIFTNGILKENPVLVTLLGICPTLAVTTTIVNGIGMGIATTFVLLCSNITISLLKRVIPEQVKLPCIIVTITGFVTFVDMMIASYVPPLYDALGIFLPLIAVNCIVFGRAEAFATKNSPFLSALDGLGMGLGFTLALVLIGTVREALGFGTLFAGTDFTISLPYLADTPVVIFILPAGGFFTFAMIIALISRIKNAPPKDFGCANCPARASCGKCTSKPTKSSIAEEDS